MADDLVFMMGQFEARIPVDRLYSDNHLWLQEATDDAPGGMRRRPDEQSVFRVGFTAYSVRLLQDVYFLDWNIDPNTNIAAKKEIGEIESSKALSTLYAPFEGRVLDFNEALLDDPSAINTDNYGSGWLYEFETDQSPLTPAQYIEVLDAGWEKTQTHLKGQIN